VHRHEEGGATVGSPRQGPVVATTDRAFRARVEARAIQYTGHEASAIVKSKAPTPQVGRDIRRFKRYERITSRRTKSGCVESRVAMEATRDAKGLPLSRGAWPP